jgi:6-pyruvoyl-tetrahydropterin synthase
MTYHSSVERTISAAHHNGPDGNKCQRNHGHDWHIEVGFTFTRKQLDNYGWGPDYGTVKKVIDDFDHQDLNEHPEFRIQDLPPSSENFAYILAQLLTNETGFEPEYVTVDEGNGNSVTYHPNED